MNIKFGHFKSAECRGLACSAAVTVYQRSGRTKGMTKLAGQWSDILTYILDSDMPDNVVKIHA